MPSTPNHFMLIGITGGLASGKTTFARLLERKGFPVFYSDEFVSSLYSSHKIISRVREVFGGSVFRNGILDKKLLAEKAFSSKARLAMLEAIVHPEVRKKLKKLSLDSNKDGGKPVFAEVPVLFEAQMQGIFGKIILVKCREETALGRAKAKGLSENEFRERARFQMPVSEKEKLADFIVDADCPVSMLRPQAEAISRELPKNTSPKGGFAA